MSPRTTRVARKRQRRTQRGELQKQALVDAAYDIIAERGFEGLRTRDVAMRVGLNVSTLHYYFRSKEDLVRSVAHRLLSEFKERGRLREGSSARPAGALERLRDAVADQDALIKAHPAALQS